MDEIKVMYSVSSFCAGVFVGMVAMLVLPAVFNSIGSKKKLLILSLSIITAALLVGWKYL